MSLDKMGEVKIMKEEWKKAIHLVEYREPKPNAHKWKYVGRTPQGGLSGGDDVHKCTLCGKYDNDPWAWDGICLKASEGGDTEIFTKYTRDGTIVERATIGKHMVIREGKKVTIIDKTIFDQFYKNNSESLASDSERTEDDDLLGKILEVGIPEKWKPKPILSKELRKVKE